VLWIFDCDFVYLCYYFVVLWIGLFLWDDVVLVFWYVCNGDVGWVWWCVWLVVLFVEVDWFSIFVDFVGVGVLLGYEWVVMFGGCFV